MGRKIVRSQDCREPGFDSPASFPAFIKRKAGLTPGELSEQLAEIHK